MIKTKLGIALLALICFTSCTDYGTKTSKGNIDTYYKDGVNEDQAKKTAALLYEMDKTSASHDEKAQKSFQLCKKNDTVCLRMVVANVESAKALGDMAFLPIANIVSDSIFHGAPINMDLTDNKFVTVKSIPYKKINFDDLEKANP